MAATVPRSSMLPTIKCSNCGDEIEISLMAEHTCTAAGEEDSSQQYCSRTNHDRIDEERPAAPSVSSRSPSVLSIETSPDFLLPRTSFVRPSKAKPPPIDALAANTLSVTPAPASSAGEASVESRSSSRVDNYLDVPFRVPPRSATVPLQQYPDHPLLEARRAHTSPNSARILDPEDGIDELYGPRSPNVLGGSNILQRMDTISPGPFNAKPRRPPLKSLGSDGARNIRVIRRDEGPPGQTTAMSSPRKPSISPSGTLPYGPPPPRPARPDRPEDLPDLLPSRSPMSESEMYRHDAVTMAPSTQQDVSSGSHHRHTPSLARSSIYTTADSDTSDYNSNQPGYDDVPPLPEIPQAQMKGFGGSNSEKRPKPSLVTSAVNGTQADKQRALNPPHTPSESASSNGSRSIFDDGTGSGRSSPPTSNGSLLSPDHPPFDSHGDHAKVEERLAVQRPGVEMERGLYAERGLFPTGAYGQARNDTTMTVRQGAPANATAQSPASLGAFTPPLESPMDPALHNGMFLVGRDRSPSPNTAAQAPTLPPPTQPRPPDQAGAQAQASQPHRPSSKGNCRGCGREIKGKSIKAADGRLTGRYHRECFVCKTCRKPFETADFYVLNNHPYCAHHYHILNHSLCHACNRGIEGRYLETSPKTIFHLGCLTCAACRQPLAQDYFELNNVPYCEADAWRVYREKTALAPGGGGARRFPERRTTRLMMM